MKRRSFLFSGAAWGLPAGAWANEGAGRPLRIVVPFAAGSGADFFARLIGPELSQALARPIVFDNKPGAGGNIGTREVAAAAPDGDTLALGTVGTHAINPTLYGNLPYDPRKAFAPVALIAAGASTLVVHPSVPARTLAELTAYARRHPGRLNMGSTGNGTSSHLCGELYKHMARVSITHIPYRSGAAATNDLVGGQLDLMFDVSAYAHIVAGRLRPLAVSRTVRTAALPQVPTMQEAGLPGFDATAWAGLFLPAAAPAALVERVHAAALQAMRGERVAARLKELGADVPAFTPAEFRAWVEREYDKWSNIVRVSGAKVD